MAGHHCPSLAWVRRGEDMTCILLARNIASWWRCGAAGGATALLQLAHAAHLNTARTLEWRQRDFAKFRSCESAGRCF